MLAASTIWVSDVELLVPKFCEPRKLATTVWLPLVRALGDPRVAGSFRLVLHAWAKCEALRCPPYGRDKRKSGPDADITEGPSLTPRRTSRSRSINVLIACRLRRFSARPKSGNIFCRVGTRR